mgnify:CR=1 FL=1|jgi:hypothetical protein
MQTETQTDIINEKAIPEIVKEVTIKYINPNTDKVEMPSKNFASIAWPTP